MTSRKVKIRLRFEGRTLDRKAVFFRPCHPNQIADAIRIICGLSAQEQFYLLDEDSDLVAISDSLEPGLYDVLRGDPNSNSPAYAPSSSNSARFISSSNLGPGARGSVTGASNTITNKSASFSSSSVRLPSGRSHDLRGGASNPYGGPEHENMQTNARGASARSHSSASRYNDEDRLGSSKRGHDGPRRMSGSSAHNGSSEWDRRSNQVQREDIARRSFRAASNPNYDGKDYKYLFKFIIVGNMSVGKSCLLMRFADDQFKENHEATIGVDFGSQIINVGGSDSSSAPVPVKVQIWDTAGQEDFRAITRAYYREACAALLVYDATNRQSFTEIQTWLEAVKNNSTNDNIVLTLVGNKSDLCGRHTGSRRVKRQEGERFADTHGLLHVETSAKTGENVTEAFARTALAVLERVRRGEVDVRDSASGVRLNSNATLDRRGSTGIGGNGGRRNIGSNGDGRRTGGEGGCC